MRRIVPISIASLLLLLAPCAVTRADSVIPYATFSDGAPGQWHYVGGNVTAVGDPGFFLSFGGPNQILNYIGGVTYDVNAFATANAGINGGMVQQEIAGQITFKSGSLTVLDVLFQGALISGLPNSNSSSITADTHIAGNVISYSTDPSFQVNPFVGPFSFSIALTQTPGLALNGNNLADFSATASGSFSSNLEGTEHNPTPLPPPAPTSLALFGALVGVRWFLVRTHKPISVHA